jgi:hypothetical protein
MTFIFSNKGQELIAVYQQMAERGYETQDGTHIDNAFSDFELRHYRAHLHKIISYFETKTLLDYGSGGSNWDLEGFHEDGKSAKEYFGLEAVKKYDPARGLDERSKVDAVICFDVLEHIHILDISKVIRDLFASSGKLLIINVACYSARAMLPNGENAHITVREPLWWKGVIDSISVEYPDVCVYLMCSTGWRNTSSYPIWSSQEWREQAGYEVKDSFYK